MNLGLGNLKENELLEVLGLDGKLLELILKLRMVWYGMECINVAENKGKWWGLIATQTNIHIA